MINGARLAKCIRSLALILAVAACDQSGLTAEEYIERAREHLASGDAAAAVIEYKNAIQRDSDNADARAELGQLYVALGDGASAEKELVRARDLGKFEAAERISLIQAMLLQGNFEDSLEEIPELAGLEPDQATVFSLLEGQALLGLNRLDEAADAFQRTLAIEPHPSAYAGLTRVAYRQRNLALAAEHVDKGLAEFPQSLDLIALSGERFLALGDPAAAENEFRRGVDLDPRGRDVANTQGYARALIVQRKFDEAKDAVERLRSIAPNSRDVALLTAVIALNDRDYEQAQDLALRVLNADGDNIMAQGIGGVSSFFVGQYERANQLLSAYLDRMPQDREARRVFGATKLRLGEPDDAVAALDALPEEIERDAAYLTLSGFAAALNGDLESGLSRLESAAAQAPQDARARARLGAFDLAAGRAEEGVEQIERALELDRQLEFPPNFDRALRTVILRHLAQRNFDDALTVAELMKRQYPDEATGYVLAGIAQRGLRNNDLARAEFEKALELRPGAPDANGNLALMEIEAGNLYIAEAHFRDTLEHNPDHFQSIVGLAGLAARQGNAEKSREWLNRAIPILPDGARPRAQLARLLLGQGDAETAHNLAREGLDADPDDLGLLSVLGAAQLRIDQVDAGVRTLERAVEISPKSADARYQLALAYGMANDGRRARSTLAKALELNPGHVRAQFALARLLIRAGELAEARPIVAGLVERFPESEDVAEIGLRLANREQEYERAVASLREGGLEASSENVRGVAIMQWRAGDRDDAISTLEGWLRSDPQETDGRILLQGFLLAQERRDAAKQVLRDVISAHPDNAAALNNLAWLLYEDRAVEEAQALAERALAVDPDNSNIKDTLGVIHADQGNVEEALELLSQAYEARPDNREIGFHLAEARVAAGDQDHARTILRAILADDVAFDDRDRAEALLEYLGK